MLGNKRRLAILCCEYEVKTFLLKMNFKLTYFIIYAKLLIYKTKGIRYMINVVDQNLLLITEKDGEVIGTVRPNESINIRSKRQTLNDIFYSPQIIVKGKFKRIMENYTQKLINVLKRNPTLGLVLVILSQYLQFNSNIILKNGEKYSSSDLAVEMGISKSMACRHIKALKEANFLAETKTKYGNRYVLNPYLTSNGTQFPKAILDLFNKENN